MTIEERYNYFVRTCVENSEVWAIEMDGGYVSFQDTAGDEIFPVYPNYDLAYYLMFEDYKIAKAQPIRMSLNGFMNKCIPDMQNLKIYFGVICNKDNYEAVFAHKLLQDLENELMVYEAYSEIPKYSP